MGNEIQEAASSLLRLIATVPGFVLCEASPFLSDGGTWQAVCVPL